MKLSKVRVGAFVFASIVAAFAIPAHGQKLESGPAGKKPVATFATGWTYLWADQGNHYRSNLNGWFVRPAVNLPHGYSIFFSNTNYYGTNAKGSVNSHGFSSGVTKAVFTHPKFKPSIFAEAGDVRASSAGTITNELLIAGGVGLSIPINKRVSLAFTPAEYVFLYPHGDWRNVYNAKAGLSFGFGRR